MDSKVDKYKYITNNSIIEIVFKVNEGMNPLPETLLF